MVATAGGDRRHVAIAYGGAITNFKQKEVMMVFTTLDFAERYLLKTEVRTSASMPVPHHGNDEWSSSDGPIDRYHHADLY